MSTPAALLLAGADGRFDASLFTPAALGSDDPFGADRLVAYNGSDGIAAGVVRTSGRFASEDFPHIEMLVVHAGKVLLYSAEPSGEQALELAPGASVVIGRGSAFKLEAEPGTLWAFCAVNRAAAGAETGLTRLDPRAMLALGGSRAADTDRRGTAMPLAQRLRGRRQRPADRGLGFHAVPPPRPAAQAQ